MLERIELPTLWPTLGERAEIYADTRLITTLILRGRILETRIECRGGLRVSSERSTRLSTDLSHGPLPTLPQRLGETEISEVSNLLRQLFPDHKSLAFRTVTLQLHSHWYEVATPSDDPRRGTEESASLEVEWGVRGKEGLEVFQERSARRNWRELLEDLRPEAWLSDAIQRSVRPPPVWPLPAGEIPVYWSARSVAKIALPFLRSFEGDRLLEGNSFLAEWSETDPLPIALQENPTAEIDHQGQPTKPVILFDGRRPRALLVDRFLGEAFSVPSTGHARRHSYREKNEVLSWGVRVHGRGEELSGLPEWGLSVRDVEVLHFNPVSAQLKLRLRDARLLHHHVEGEAVEPVVLELNLLDLMRSWRAFSSDVKTVGDLLYKEERGFVTELEVPAALSPRVQLPGQVPPQHYW